MKFKFKRDLTVYGQINNSLFNSNKPCIFVAMNYLGTDTGVTKILFLIPVLIHYQANS